MTECADYGLIGAKLGHSLSPEIHASLGAYRYDLIEIPEEELKDFLTAGRFRGLNVTIPYKKAVIPFCDDLTPRARAIGSVNTLMRREDGTLLGDNTDYAGFMAMVAESGLDPKGKKCLVLGSGGASLTVCAVLYDLGAANVTVVSRSGENHYGNLERHADAALIVNTTPVGMSPACDASPLASLDGFPALEGVLDLIYNPAVTNLMQLAIDRGVPAVNGLTMLVTQAAEASALWFGTDARLMPVGAIRRELARRAANVVLIGMPGCGKSTVGRQLAERIHRPFVDLDAVVREAVGMTPGEIIRTRGEAAFRDVETEVLRTVADRHGLVIATGGGAILREENRRLMRRNGMIFWLDRPLKDLAVKGRPLSLSRGVEALYAEREPLYRALAHRRIVCNNVASALSQILGGKS